MAPKKICSIDLSSGGGWVQSAHLPYLQQSSRCQITGICNSSRVSSWAAIQAFDLPTSTTVYGSLDGLADNADSFDLVVCSVRVDKHYAALRPVLTKGKACHVEWPLGTNVQEAEEINDLPSKSGNARTMVGLQARKSPVVDKVKCIVAEGMMGRILSSTVVTSAGKPGQIDVETERMLNDSKIQATMLTIHFADMSDDVLYVIGEELGDLSAILSTQHRIVQLKHADGILCNAEKDTPDQIMLHGHLSGGSVPEWKLYGEKGVIEITAAGCFLRIGYDDMEIELHNHEADTVQIVNWTVDDASGSLPLPARNVARLYEAFAEDRLDEYAQGKVVVAGHRLLDKIMENSESGRSVLLRT